MAAAAAGRAVGDLLNLLETLQHAFEPLHLVQRVLNVAVGHLLSVADHLIFTHRHNQSLLSFLYHITVGPARKEETLKNLAELAERILERVREKAV